MIGGDAQTAPAGHALASPLVVKVTDNSGNAVPGVSVNWGAQGGGSVSTASVKTGSDGRASVTRTLGSTVGEQATTATATKSDGSPLDGAPVTFVATAVTGTPGVSVVTQPPPSALSGEVFDPTAQPVVSVGDNAGGPLSGVTVTASVASGTLGGHDHRHHQCQRHRDVRGPRHSGRRFHHHQVHRRNRQRQLGQHQHLRTVESGYGRGMGSTGQLGHRATAHGPDAEWKDHRVGQDGRPARHDGYAADLGSRIGPAQRRSDDQCRYHALLRRLCPDAGWPIAGFRGPPSG